MNELKLLSVVALTRDDHAAGLRQGQVGTVVELLPPDAAEVEFVDNRGRTYAVAAVRLADLLVLHYEAQPQP